MMNTLLRTSVITTLFLISHTSYAEIYKWVDSSGKVHYSQTPPASTQVENISNKIRMATGKGQNTTSHSNTANTESNTPTTSESNVRTPPTPAKNFCQQQQNILQQLLSNPVVKWNDGKGEKLLNAKQRQAKIEEYEASVTKACDNETTENTTNNNKTRSIPSQTNAETMRMLRALEE